MSADTCISDTTAVFKGQSNGLSAECISCACNESATKLEACNAVAADCWGLIACYDDHKCADTQCALDNCGQFTTKGGGPAQPVGDILTGKTGNCAAKCAAEGTDAGTQDAGN